MPFVGEHDDGQRAVGKEGVEHIGVVDAKEKTGGLIGKVGRLARKVGDLAMDGRYDLGLVDDRPGGGRASDGLVYAAGLRFAAVVRRADNAEIAIGVDAGLDALP